MSGAAAKEYLYFVAGREKPGGGEEKTLNMIGGADGHKW